jgi:hypothetical protein
METEENNIESVRIGGVQRKILIFQIVFVLDDILTLKG